MTSLNIELQLDSLFHALSDTTRRTIIQLIAKQSLTVSEISAHFDISLNAVSKHLKVLEKANLLNRNKEGRTYHCQTNLSALSDASDFLSFYEPFWNQNLDNLEHYLNPKESKHE